MAQLLLMLQVLLAVAASCCLPVACHFPRKKQRRQKLWKNHALNFVCYVSQ